VILKNGHQPINQQTNKPTNQHIYFNIHRKPHIAFVDQFVIQSQGPLNLCYSINNQFPTNNWISREDRTTIFKTHVHVFRWNLWKAYTLDCSSLVCFLNKKINKEWMNKSHAEEIRLCFLHCLQSNSDFKKWSPTNTCLDEAWRVLTIVRYNL
jgi:hypothetical protein